MNYSNNIDVFVQITFVNYPFSSDARNDGSILILSDFIRFYVSSEGALSSMTG